jgi:hypothetical protein
MSSNPVVTIGSYIPPVGDPAVIRKTFARVVYDSQKFFLYGDTEFGSFDPTEKGEEFFVFVPFLDAMSSTQPSFVSDDSWDGLQKSSSGFVTAVNSIMPKIVVPSKLLIDNGIITPNGKFAGKWFDGASFYDNFSWELVSFNGTSIGPSTTEVYKFSQQGPNCGAQYVSIKAKDDKPTIGNLNNTFVMKLDEPASPPPATDYEGGLVVKGAFVLLLNVMPTRPASGTPNKASEKPWLVTLEFGEVKMIIGDSGSTEIVLGQGGGGGEENKTTINLAEGKAKGGPPQQQHMTEKDPYVILVYPVWNGLVVASGIQDARATVFSSSYYVPKLKSASIMLPPYSNGFDPTTPDEVEVDVGTGATSVMVDFGDTLTLTADNCRLDVAYLPCYFAQNCYFDEWRMYSDDQGGVVSYSYYVYPIWTANTTSSTLTPPPDVTDSGYPGSISDTHYGVTEWRLEQTLHNRIGGEIFGSILETDETWQFPIKNGNGAFTLTSTGGSPGGPGGVWTDYIQSVTCTVNLDGSSGSIVVDKYGIAGQHAEVIQSIGAITIDATGANGTVPGRIFTGLGMGTADNRSTDGATWNIPLVGLEKKLDDIMLINVPFFDGETLSVVLDFLSRYAGLNANMASASPAVTLGVTDDINAVRFDWKAGTTVRSALDDVMADTLHSYVVRDGYIYFYSLNSTTGLPNNLGPDRSGSYPNTKIVMYDAAPDFEDLRNEIVVLALQEVADGQGSNLENLPAFTRIVAQNNATTPDVPWAKTLVRPLPGMLDQTKITTAANRLSASCSVYELIGRTTIPGNADIKPYDTWGSFVIFGVTHNIDLKTKNWTMDLEFMRNTR